LLIIISGTININGKLLLIPADSESDILTQAPTQITHSCGQQELGKNDADNPGQHLFLSPKGSYRKFALLKPVNISGFSLKLFKAKG